MIILVSELGPETSIAKEILLILPENKQHILPYCQQSGSQCGILKLVD